MIRGTLSALCVVAVVGCGGHASSLNLKGTAGAKISHAADVAVPSTVLGLSVTQEDVSKSLANAQRSYIESLVMYGMRADSLLQATFQVSRFNPGTKYTADKFQLALVDQIGTATPFTATVGGTRVFLTSGNRQNISVWFKGPYFFVLATRQDFGSPRALLRELIAVNP